MDRLPNEQDDLTATLILLRHKGSTDQAIELLERYRYGFKWAMRELKRLRGRNIVRRKNEKTHD